jgi:hypothetical protein
MSQKRRLHLAILILILILIVFQPFPVPSSVGGAISTLRLKQTAVLVCQERRRAVTTTAIAKDMKQATANLSVCECTMLGRVAVEWATRPVRQARPPGAVGSHALPDAIARSRPLNPAAGARTSHRPTAWLCDALRTASGGHGVEEALFGLVAVCGAAAVGMLLVQTTQFVIRWPAFTQLVSRLIG